MMRDCSTSDDLNLMAATVDQMCEIYDDLADEYPERTHTAIQNILSYALKLRLIEKFGEIYLTPNESDALEEVITWAKAAIFDLEEFIDEH